MKKIISCLFIFFLSFQTSFAKTYVLVPGAFTDGSAWYKIKVELEKQHHTVLIVNRRAFYKGGCNMAEGTLEKYVTQIVDCVNAQNEKVILVAHSLGGYFISQVAEQIPQKISCLVYITALIPKNGETVFDILKNNTKSITPEYMKPDNDKTYFEVLSGGVKNAFCNDCSPEDVAYYELASEGRIEPYTPFLTPIVLTDANFNSVKKIIIQTVNDKAITYDFQKEYAKTTKNVKQVYQINSAHSPFLSNSKELSKILIDLN